MTFYTPIDMTFSHFPTVQFSGRRSTTELLVSSIIGMIELNRRLDRLECVTFIF